MEKCRFELCIGGGSFTTEDSKIIEFNKKYNLMVDNSDRFESRFRVLFFYVTNGQYLLDCAYITVGVVLNKI